MTEIEKPCEECSGKGYRLTPAGSERECEWCNGQGWTWAEREEPDAWAEFGFSPNYENQGC